MKISETTKVNIYYISFTLFWAYLFREHLFTKEDLTGFIALGVICILFKDEYKKDIESANKKDRG